MINPGVPYISTSIAEIFQSRNAQKEADNMKALNPFISVQNTPNGKSQFKIIDLYRTEVDEPYIYSRFNAYQLKTINRIKNVEEVDWENEEEDALILAH